MPKTEADLLELMRADRLVLDDRLAVQTAVDIEAAGEHIPPIKDPARLETTAPRRRIGARFTPPLTDQDTSHRIDRSNS
jgi:hypothetical protein